MTVEQIIRNFNLYIITDIELDGQYLSIYNDLEKWFNNLQLFKIKNSIINEYQLCYGKDINDIRFIHIKDKTQNFIDSYYYSYLGNKYVIFGNMDSIFSWYIEYKYGLKGKSIKNGAVKDYINKNIERNNGKLINI